MNKAMKHIGVVVIYYILSPDTFLVEMDTKLKNSVSGGPRGTTFAGDLP